MKIWPNILGFISYPVSQLRLVMSDKLKSYLRFTKYSNRPRVTAHLYSTAIIIDRVLIYRLSSSAWADNRVFTCRAVSFSVVRRWVGVLPVRRIQGYAANHISRLEPDPSVYLSS